MTAGRWAAGSSVTTASWAVTRASGIRIWSTTTIRSSRRLSAEEGYHLTEDLTDKAIDVHLRRQTGRSRQAVLLTSATGATHAPHHVPEGLVGPLPGKFDGGWDQYRETVFARQKQMGIVPPDAKLSAHDPDVPVVGHRSVDERGGCTPG